MTHDGAIIACSKQKRWYIAMGFFALLLTVALLASQLQPVSEGDSVLPAFSANSNSPWDLLASACDADSVNSDGFATRRTDITRAILPPVQFVEINHNSKMRLATLCADQEKPLRITLVFINESMLEEQTRNFLKQKTHPQTKSILITLLAFDNKLLHFCVFRITGDKQRASQLFRGSTHTVETHGRIGIEGISPKKSLLGQLSELLTKRYATTNTLNLLARPAHFVYQCNTLFTLENIKALCYFDAVVNQESEAIATYSWEALADVSSRSHRDNIGFVSVDNGRLVVTSTCRKPSVVNNIVNSDDTFRNGSSVIRGAYRFVTLNMGEDGYKVFIPYFLGIHSDIIVGPMPPASRDTIIDFQRRPLGNYCSHDKNEPTRVVSHIPFFFGPSATSSQVFFRNINATAHMSEWSDAVITTNALAKDVALLLRNEANTDDFYLNNRSMLIFIQFREQTPDQHLAALSQWNVVSQKGFYDIVRYSEDDSYVARDQFEFFCVTLPILEAKNMYLNFLRFEMEGELPLYDVLHAYLPSEVLLLDESRDTMDWSWSQGPEGVLVSNSGVDAVPVTTCRSEPFSFNLNLNAPLLPQFTTSDDITGCYILAKPRHSSWNSPNIYNGMYMVVDERISFIERDKPPWRFTLGLQRENVAHFHAPTQSYDRSVILLMPHPSESSHELYRLHRLGAINHGSNRFVKKDRKAVAPPLFRVIEF